MVETASTGGGQSLLEVIKRRSTTALITFVIVMIAVLAVVMIYKVKYGALSHVLLVSEPNGRNPADTGVDMPTIATGSTVLLDVKQRLGLSYSLDQLRKNVNARVAPKSSLMTIAVLDHDPNLAVKIANTVSDTFSSMYFQLAGSRYDEVTRRLQNDVREAKARVVDLDRRLEGASAGSTYVGSATSLDATAAHLAELQEARGVAFAQYTTDNANLQADLGDPTKTAKIVRYEILRNNPAYYQTETLVGKDVAEYTTTRAGVKPSFPGIAGFQDKVQQESAELQNLRAKALTAPDAYSPSQAGQMLQTQKDQSAVAGDREKLAAYDTQIDSLRKQLSSTAGTESIGALRSQRDAADAQFQQLSLNLSQAEASRAQASALGEVVVVDRATEAHPTLVGPVLLLVLGLLAASILAIAAAYLAELLVPRFIGSRDVENVYGRPLLVTLRAQ